MGRGISELTYQPESDKFVVMMNQRLIRVSPDFDDSFLAVKPTETLDTLQTLGYRPPQDADEFHKQQKDMGTVMSWADIHQLFPSVPMVSQTKSDSFVLSFPSESIVSLIYVHTVHCFFISTSEPRLYVLDKEGNVVHPGGILAEEEEERKRNARQYEEMQRDEKAEKGRQKRKDEREANEKKKHFSPLKQTIAAVSEEKESSILTISPRLLAQSVMNQEQPRTRKKRRTPTSTFDYFAQPKRLSTSLVPIFSHKGGVDWTDGKGFLTNTSTRASGDDSPHRQHSLVAVSLAYNTALHILIAGFEGGNARLFKFTPNYYPHTTTLAKFRLEYIGSIGCSSRGWVTTLCSPCRVHALEETTHPSCNGDALYRQFPAHSNTIEFYTTKMDTLTQTTSHRMRNYREACPGMDSGRASSLSPKCSSPTSHHFESDLKESETDRTTDRYVKLDIFKEKRETTSNTMSELSGFLDSLRTKEFITSQRNQQDRGLRRSVEVRPKPTQHQHSLPLDSISENDEPPSHYVPSPSPRRSRSTPRASAVRRSSLQLNVVDTDHPISPPDVQTARSSKVNSPRHFQRQTPNNPHANPNSNAKAFIRHTMAALADDQLASSVLVGVESTLACINLSDRKLVWERKMAHPSRITVIVFLPQTSGMSQDFILSGGMDGSLKAWTANGDCLISLQPHVKAITSIVTLPHSCIFFTSSHDGTVKAINALTGQIISSHIFHSPINALTATLPPPAPRLRITLPLPLKCTSATQSVNPHLSPSSKQTDSIIYVSLCAATPTSLPRLSFSLPVQTWFSIDSPVHRFQPIQSYSTLKQSSISFHTANSSSNLRAIRNLHHSLAPTVMSVFFSDGSIRLFLPFHPTSLAYSLPSTVHAESLGGVCACFDSGTLFVLDTTTKSIVKLAAQSSRLSPEPHLDTETCDLIIAMSSLPLPLPEPSQTHPLFKIHTRFFRNANNAKPLGSTVYLKTTTKASKVMIPSVDSDFRLPSRSGRVSTFSTASKGGRRESKECLLCGSEDGTVSVFSAEDGRFLFSWQAAQDEQITFVEFVPNFSPFLLFPHGVVSSAQTRPMTEVPEIDSIDSTPARRRRTTVIQRSTSNFKTDSTQQQSSERDTICEQRRRDSDWNTSSRAVENKRRTGLEEAMEEGAYGDRGLIVVVTINGTVQLWDALTLTLLSTSNPPVDLKKRGVVPTSFSVLPPLVAVGFSNGAVAIVHPLSHLYPLDEERSVERVGGDPLQQQQHPLNPQSLAHLESEQMICMLPPRHNRRHAQSTPQNHSPPLNIHPHFSPSDSEPTLDLPVSYSPPVLTYTFVPRDGWHSNRVTCMSSCPSLNLFASCSVDSTIKLWCVNEELIREIFFNSISTPHLAVSFVGCDGSLCLEHCESVAIISPFDFLPPDYDPARIAVSDLPNGSKSLFPLPPPFQPHSKFIKKTARVLSSYNLSSEGLVWNVDGKTVGRVGEEEEKPTTQHSVVRSLRKSMRL
ncbi:hypothetical protein BLNAU_17640 [Blattamonas nauphoetae]|uniref:Uncharacterized protein n=1 Tax=Blattamonas nauphoetae TaxID=2049346 RepID=A0ABQ9X937_9EUKA|nr:hypothetical protein BLNAU_17640 [Blattamonas nauphoetae]